MFHIPNLSTMQHITVVKGALSGWMQELGGRKGNSDSRACRQLYALKEEDSLQSNK